MVSAGRAEAEEARGAEEGAEPGWAAAVSAAEAAAATAAEAAAGEEETAAEAETGVSSLSPTEEKLTAGAPPHSHA